MTGTAKSGARTSMNVTGTNPESETNIGSDVTVDVNRETDVNVDDVNVSSEDQQQTDVRTRVEQVSGIRLQNVQFSEGGDENSVEAFEKAVARENPEGPAGLGRQYANTARQMGYSVKFKK